MMKPYLSARHDRVLVECKCIPSGRGQRGAWRPEAELAALEDDTWDPEDDLLFCESRDGGECRCVVAG